MLESADDPREDVRQLIRAAILSGDLAPGQRLIEADLCQRFSVSRFILREALRDLATQGLVEFARNRGARVRDVSLREAVEITEVRRAIEGFVAARAAERVTPEDIRELRELVTAMRTAVSEGELLRYSELNASLHSALRRIAGHQIAADMLAQLRDVTVRHRFSLSLIPGRSSVSLPQHEAIVAAVIAGDAEGAERTMHVHLDSVIAALSSQLGAAVPAPVT